MSHRFAIATCEELRAGELIESRISHGVLEQTGNRINATDAVDEELLSRAQQHLREACGSVLAGHARIVASSRRAGDRTRDEVTIVLTVNDLSLVTSPEHAREDAEWLAMCGAPPTRRRFSYRGIPILWTRGAGSVLLHEAVGHAAEHRAKPLHWPDWLSVCDEPDFDDTGATPTVADLLKGDAPRAMRRASFGDVALPRMSNVVVRQHGSSIDAPERRIEISLLSGGSYEPLTDTVTLFVSVAHLVEGYRTRLPPFIIEESREAICRALRGASGESQRYPGVICSAEGQHLLVGSAAPVMLTEF